MFEKLKQKRRQKRLQKLRDSANSIADTMRAFYGLTKNMSDVFESQFPEMTEGQTEQDDE